MACGLFGKLIAKRDFIAVNTPREVLLGWETWMQSSIAASKHGLGQTWLGAYMQAPLWRFWLDGRVCGMEVMGVFMSSMDGVGRHFPLTVFTFAESGQRFAVPADGGDQSWYEEAEDFLLSTLDAGEDYDLVLASLARLRDGPAQAHVTPERTVLALHGAVITFGPAALPQPADVAPATQMPATAEALGLAEEPATLPEPSKDDVAGDPSLLAAVPADHASYDRTGDDRTGDDCSTAEPSKAGAPQAVDVASSVDGLVQDVPRSQEAESPQPVSAELPENLDTAPAKADNDVDLHVDLHVGAQFGGPPDVQTDFGFVALAADLQASATTGRSFWWTVGGHEHPAMAMIAEGLPDPQLMSLMLTGKPNHPAN